MRNDIHEGFLYELKEGKVVFLNLKFLVDPYYEPLLWFMIISIIVEPQENLNIITISVIS